MSTANVVTVFEGWDLDTSEPNEPRARGIDIATRAGLAQPRKVRGIIERNLEELGAHGAVMMRAQCARIIKSGGNGGGGIEERTVNEYWLNEPQAMALIALMRTPAARKLRIEMVRVFVAWRRGVLSAPPPPVAIPEDRPSQTAVIQARIGDDARLRVCLKSLCAAAARTSGRSVQSIHGELRKPWGVVSIYRIALSAYQHTAYVLSQIIDESLNIRRLPAHKKQVEFPWGPH